MKTFPKNKQAGAVSLFVVIFAMLLLTVVTVSFLRLMMTDLRQAGDTDLSQSAYDSAQAGVEDAKRALLRYQAYCATASEADCTALGAKLSSTVCNEGVREGGVAPGTSGEVPVQTTTTSSQSASFNQAYTCVTMNLNTDDVVGKAADGSSKYIPLIGTSSFNQVTISWFDKNDLPPDVSAVSLASQASPNDLLKQGSGASTWPTTRPPVLRAQLMQVGSTFSLDQFDYVSGGQSNSNALFLFPTRDGSSTSSFSGRDIRADSLADSPDADTPDSSPLAARCEQNISAGGYSCSMTLDLPDPMGGGVRQGYLRLTPFYKGASFQVKLADSTRPGVTVQFKAVQPSIDATGRANDLYRRVESRVELTSSSLPLPEAAVDVTTEFCKDFTVTDALFIQAVCTYS